MIVTESDHRNNAATLAACLRGIDNIDLRGVGHIISNLDRKELELLATLAITHLANTFIELPEPAFTSYVEHLTRIGQMPSE